MITKGGGGVREERDQRIIFGNQHITLHHQHISSQHINSLSHQQIRTGKRKIPTSTQPIAKKPIYLEAIEERRRLREVLTKRQANEG